MASSLAPIGRAALFFGFMGVAVASLTVGAELQPVRDQSSTTIAQMKNDRNLPSATQFAAVDPGQQLADRTKRAIPTSQAAMIRAEERHAVR